MATKSKIYWQQRAIRRLVEAENRGNIAIGQTIGIYEQAQANIEKQIQSVFDNYAEKGILSPSELKKFVTSSEKQQFLKAIKKNALKLGLNPDEVYDERYFFRLTRLQAIQEQMKLEIMATAPDQVQIQKNAYTDITRESYRSSQVDLQSQGVTPAFATLDTPIVDAILRSQWYGGNYSSRIWKNTSDLADKLPTILGGSMAAGESYQKTIATLRESFNVGKFEASRLIRTETNNIHNQAELQSYVDDGIEEYDYDAVMDGRTSKICRLHNGKRYKVKDAKTGVNYPPLHPFCRSTTAAVIPDNPTPLNDQRLRLGRLVIGPDNELIAARYGKALVDSVQKQKEKQI